MTASCWVYDKTFDTNEFQHELHSSAHGRSQEQLKSLSLADYEGTAAANKSPRL